MEFRKLISFGKTSFVMSIPKAWILNNKLKKGDLISLYEKEGSLVLSPKKEKTGCMEQKEIMIDTTDKDMNRIKREITSAYINNFNPIIITGKNLTEKTSEIRKALGDLIALEVMEQSATKIIAKDFLSMDKISINNSIKKMDMITRSMLSDSEIIKSEQDYNSIYHRDEDMNRLTFLIYRTIKYVLENPDMLRHYNMKSDELVHFWFFATNLEKIADNIKRIARNFNELRSDPKLMGKLLPLLAVVKKQYLKTMKAFYEKDIVALYEIAHNKRDLILEFEKVSKKNSKHWLICDSIDKMQQIIADITEVTKTAYLFLTKPSD